MKIDVLTLFPNMFFGVINESIMGRAINADLISINVHNIRDYSESKHKNADDYPFGGGCGMVMMPQPIISCLNAVDPEHKALRVVMAPRGKTLSTELARKLSTHERIVILCGHYEGIDERAMEEMDMELSVGDYILTGGELPAMVLMDCVSRFIPGVLGSADSAEDESFSTGLLEYPQYTRPSEYMGKTVPEVLTSGNHAKIERWRRDRALELTYNRRPELLNNAVLDKKDKAFLMTLKASQNTQND